MWTKCTTLRSRMLLFHAVVSLTASKHTNAHTGWGEPQTHHVNSLNVDKRINSISSQKYTGICRVYLMKTYYPLLSEIFASVQSSAPFSNTRILEYHETLGIDTKDFKSSHIYHIIALMELNINSEQHKSVPQMDSRKLSN